MTPTPYGSNHGSSCSCAGPANMPAQQQQQQGESRDCTQQALQRQAVQLPMTVIPLRSKRAQADSACGWHQASMPDDAPCCCAATACRCLAGTRRIAAALAARRHMLQHCTCRSVPGAHKQLQGLHVPPEEAGVHKYTCITTCCVACLPACPSSLSAVSSRVLGWYSCRIEGPRPRLCVHPAADPVHGARADNPTQVAELELQARCSTLCLALQLPAPCPY